MKAEIRADVLERRERLTAAEVEEKSKKIAARLLKLNEFEKAGNILLYSSKGNEVDTVQIMQQMHNKQAIYPRTNVEKAILELYKVANLKELEPGVFGLMEPRKDLEIVQAQDVELALIPGVAFDAGGNRIGYGLGFYDKLLKQVNAKKVGLAFEIQVVDKIEPEEHDIKADIIITEERTINCEV